MGLSHHLQPVLYHFGETVQFVAFRKATLAQGQYGGKVPSPGITLLPGLGNGRTVGYGLSLAPDPSLNQTQSPQNLPPCCQGRPASPLEIRATLWTLLHGQRTAIVTRIPGAYALPDARLAPFQGNGLGQARGERLQRREGYLPQVTWSLPHRLRVAAPNLSFTPHYPGAWQGSGREGKTRWWPAGGTGSSP